MAQEKTDITKRLIEFGQSRFGNERGWRSRFAEALNVQPGHLQSYLMGKTPGPELHIKLRALGCDIEWLMTGYNVMDFIGTEENDLLIDTIPLVKIPVYQYIKSGGKVMALKETPSSYIVTNKSDDKTLFAVIVKGDTMSPEINEGDHVVVSKQQDPKNGDICLVFFNEKDALLRKVYYHDRGITLVSINEKEYPPKDFKKSALKHIYKVVQKITNY
jgi:repressor LexA